MSSSTSAGFLPEATGHGEESRARTPRLPLLAGWLRDLRFPCQLQVQAVPVGGSVTLSLREEACTSREQGLELPARAASLAELLPTGNNWEQRGLRIRRSETAVRPAPILSA